MTESCMEVCFTQFRVIVIFEPKHFTRLCSDAFKVWWWDI